jgi:hypothetical protein
MDPCQHNKERGEATLLNVTFPTKSVPALTETMPELFSQRLYSSEQRWEGINAQVYQLRPPREPLHVQVDCDTIILHLHSVVDLQREVGARLERGISYKIEQVVAEMGRNDPRRVEIMKQFNIHAVWLL